jgi:class 3 adenylate cyclase
MRACPRCGEENPDRARFCLRCGEPLAEAEERRRERKYATALFADLVGSTSLAEREDPEVVQEVVGRAFDRLAEEVDRYEGLLDLGRAQRRAGQDPGEAFGRARELLLVCDARLFVPEVDAELAG